MLIVETRPEPGVALLRINRPEARNALSLETRRELAGRMQALTKDADIRCAVLTGDDKVFSAGADLASMVTASPIELVEREVHLLWEAIADFPKPLIAAVNGFALGGGCELAMHADIIIAGESAKFGQPEIKVGIMPGAGGTVRLTRLIGRTRAMRLLLTGEMISGAEAFAWGLVSEVVPDKLVLSRGLEMAMTIAAMPALAARQIKEVVLASQDAPLAVSLALERKAFHLLFDTRDQREGMTAFLEKRPARFNTSDEA